MNIKQQAVLVVAAHPDDEALGCGGTIAKWVANSCEVTVIFMTNGVAARGDDKVAAQQRFDAATAAASSLGITDVRVLDLPDNKMDGLALLDIIQPLETVVAGQAFSTVLTHHGGDLNIDHRLTHQAVLTAFRPQPGQTVKRILCFEVNSATEWASSAQAPFIPNYFVDISDFWPDKVTALDHYNEEMRAYPHTRSIEAIEALSVVRGTSVGVAKAEAFMIERWLD
ncbi:MAG: LmbE family N-acetylglucosaminyl deacetylase [Phenylobacterium sp.]|jgi:LmbE family N-acetylglucosaminyl deacetylase